MSKKRVTKHLHGWSSGLVVLIVLGLGLGVAAWRMTIGQVGAQAVGNPAYSFNAVGDFDASASTTDPVLTGIGGSGSAYTLALGDFRYGAKTDEEGWCSYVRNLIGPGQPFELVTGNHDNPGGGQEGTFTTSSIDNVLDLSGNVTNYGFTQCLPDMLGSTGAYGREYYFDYNNNTRVIMVSPDLAKYNPDGSLVDAYAYSGPGDVHYDWLGQRIDEAKQVGKWVIVGMHKPCITVGDKSCEIGAPVLQLMMDKHVDLVLTGHDHIYQRSHALAGFTVNQAPVAGNIMDDGTDNYYPKGMGTVLVTVGTGGRPGLYSVMNADNEDGYYVVKMGGDSPSGGTYGYVKVDVTDEALVVNFVPQAGNLAFTDSFSIGIPSTPTVGPSATPTTAPAIVTLNPAADVRVQEDTPTNTYGTSSYIRANNGSGNKARSYMKFNLTGQSGVLLGAKLRLYINSASGSGTADTHLVKAMADTSWVENTVNWANYTPVLGQQLGTLPPAGATGALVEANLDPVYVQSKLGTTMGLAIDYCVVGTTNCATIDSVNYDSREGTNKPQLVLYYDTLGGGQGGTPTAVPTATVVPTNTVMPTSTVIPTPTTVQNVLTFAPAKDATIKQANANTNYGSGVVIGADKDTTNSNKPNKQEDFLISFNVAGVVGRPVVQAKLRFYVVDASNGSGGTVYKSANNSWVENTTTWANAPLEVLPAITTINTPVSINTWKEAIVTSAVVGDGTVSFRVKSSSTDGVDYSSKEAATNRPQLVVTVQ